MHFLTHTLVLQVLALSLWLAILAAIFVPLERVLSLRRQDKILRTGFWKDIGLYFLNGLLPAFLIAVPMTVLAELVHKVQPLVMRDFIASLPVWLRFILALLVLETGSYWGHRISHSNRFLWRFHAMHHAPVHLDWLVNTCAHPLDIVYVRLCGLVPLYALGLAQFNAGAPSALPAIALFVATLWSFFVHANINLRFGFLEKIIVTPAFHHWHHVNNQNSNKNFATSLAFIDRIFGSYHLPKDWPPAYGLYEEPRSSRGTENQVLAK